MIEILTINIFCKLGTKKDGYIELKSKRKINSINIQHQLIFGLYKTKIVRMSTYEPMGYNGKKTEILTPCILCSIPTLGTIITPRRLICDTREKSDPLPYIKLEYIKLHICLQPGCRQKIITAVEALLDLQRNFNQILARKLKPLAFRRPKPDEIILALEDYFPRCHIDLIHFVL